MKILYFGVLSEITEKQSENIRFSGSVNELMKELTSRYPGFAVQRYQIAINQQLADPDRMLNEQDEIALLPPFTGG